MSKYLYLSGPMTGYANFNREAFHEAAAYLRGLGMKVWNPAEHDPPEIEQYVEDRRLPEDLWEQLLDKDVQVIREECEGIVLLPGWTRSPGAKEELFQAIAYGLKVMDYMDLRSPIFSCSRE